MGSLVDRLSLLISVDGLEAASGKFKALGSEAEKSQGKAAGASSKLSGAINAVSENSGMAVAAVVAFGAKSIDAYQKFGTEVLTLQRLTGGTADESSRLAFALQQTGTDVETASKSFGAFSKNLANTPDVFTKYGIATQDASGKTMSFHDVLLATATDFQNMPDGAEKTAEAMKLFGKAGKDMIPFLNRGAEGIAALEKETSQYGMTLSGKNLSDIKANKEAQREFGAALQGIQVMIGKELLPQLTKLTTQVTDIVKPVSSVIDEFHSLDDATHGLLSGLIDLTTLNFGGVWDHLTSMWDEIWGNTKKATLSVDDFAASMKISKPAAQDFIDTQKAAGTTFTTTADASTAYTAALAEGTVTTDQAGAASTTFADHVKDVNKELSDAKKAVDDAKNALTGYFDTLTGNLDLESQYQASVDALTESVKKNGATTDLNTQTGRDNLKAIEDVRNAILDKAKAAAEESGNVQTGIDMANLYSTSLYNQLLNLGWTKKAAADYIAQLGLTQPQINTAFTQSGLQQAMNDTRTFTNMLANLDGKTVSVGVKTEWGGNFADLAYQIHAAGLTFHAKGGMVSDGLFVVGEDGPELMRKQGGQVEIGSNPSTVGGHKISSGTSGTIGGNNYTLNFPNYLGSKDELKGWIADSMRQLERAAS